MSRRQLNATQREIVRLLREHGRAGHEMLCASIGQVMEVGLGCELLEMWGVIDTELDAYGALVYSLRDRAARRAMASCAPRRRVFRPNVSRTGQALGGVAAVTLLAGCSVLNRPMAEEPRVVQYQMPPGPRIVQLYDFQKGPVFRYCQGAECPMPTPKRIINSAAMQPIEPHVPTPVGKMLEKVGGHNPAERALIEKLRQLKTGKAAQGAPASGATTSEGPSALSRSDLAGSPKSELVVAAPDAVAQADEPVPQLSPVTIEPGEAAQAMKPDPSPVATNESEKGATPAALSAPATRVAPIALDAAAELKHAEKSQAAPEAEIPAALADEQHGVHADASAEPAPGMMAPEAFAEHWAAAWSNRDTGAYFDLYGQDFRSPSGRTKSQWQGARKYIMEHAERIDVTLEHVKVTPRGERTLVDFWQTYESDRFRSRVPKRLVLAGGPGQWRIVGEGVRTRSSGEASA